MGTRGLGPTAQGQGVGTRRKEDGFAAAFAISLDISKSERVRRFPYWHVDLNAGCGFNEAAGCEGSPLVFLREAIAAGRPFYAYFCDLSPKHCDALRDRLSVIPIPPGSAAYISNTDNAIFLSRMAAKITREERAPQCAIGSLVCDPNGYKHGLPREALAKFAADFPRIDIILNINCSLFSRVRGAKEDGQSGFDGWPTIAEIAKSIPRPSWMVREPTPGGSNDRFITLVGRTLETGRRAHREFYPLESSQGQHIITTYKRLPDEQQTIKWRDRP